MGPKAKLGTRRKNGKRLMELLKQHAEGMTKSEIAYSLKVSADWVTYTLRQLKNDGVYIMAENVKGSRQLKYFLGEGIKKDEVLAYKNGLSRYQKMLLDLLKASPKGVYAADARRVLGIDNVHCVAEGLQKKGVPIEIQRENIPTGFGYVTRFILKNNERDIQTTKNKCEVRCEILELLGSMQNTMAKLSELIGGGQ